MNIAILHILHVGSLFVLAAFTFYALAKPVPETRKMVMIVTGIMSLIALLTGFGMLGVMKLGFPLWSIIKLVCWLGLAGVAGIAYRKPEKTGLLCTVAIVLILIAVSTVYLHPYIGN